MAARSVPSRRMKVLHLAAGNRWTGAAAPAFAETEALREAGVEAHYAYVGCYKLQQKLAHYDFAHSIRERDPTFTPPPVDQRQFAPHGADVRDRYGIGAEELLLVAIGKLSKGRGFEDVLQTYAFLKRDLANARLMIIGHGEHRPALEALARELHIDVIWAGYHEDDLAEHYRAADILLFTARGSDEGHRAVLEAMSCGIAPVTFPIEGIPALLGDLAPRLIAQASSPEAAAAKVIAASADLANL